MAMLLAEAGSATGLDPHSEPLPMAIYVLIGDQQSGPFTVEELRLLWDAGEIPPDAAYWYDGVPSWTPIAEFRPPPVVESNLTACADCGGTVSKRAATCPHCGAPIGTRNPLPPQFIQAPAADAVRCPRCRTTQVHAGKRGWNALTGLIGSGKVALTCLKCGHRFEPGR